MNKYQEDFDRVQHLNPLDNRERICLNYGLEEGRIERNKDFKALLKCMLEAYPSCKENYVELDVYIGDVLTLYAQKKEKNEKTD